MHRGLHTRHSQGIDDTSDSRNHAVSAWSRRWKRACLYSDLADPPHWAAIGQQTVEIGLAGAEPLNSEPTP
jgi:hypothetical protein